MWLAKYDDPEAAGVGLSKGLLTPSRRRTKDVRTGKQRLQRRQKGIRPGEIHWPYVALKGLFLLQLTTFFQCQLGIMHLDIFAGHIALFETSSDAHCMPQRPATSITTYHHHPPDPITITYLQPPTIIPPAPAPN